MVIGYDPVKQFVALGLGVARNIPGTSVSVVNAQVYMGDIDVSGRGGQMSLGIKATILGYGVKAEVR